MQSNVACLYCCVFQALDVWAMGVTLYCFLFGKVRHPIPPVVTLPLISPYQLKPPARRSGQEWEGGQG